ncbi:MAG: efflux RND transporter periplasmic adaptor subunit [Nitrospirota bacterium]|nr:efflux RND transporter periplasmic adaptor subunit [Nitrospirota bacterium]
MKKALRIILVIAVAGGIAWKLYDDHDKRQQTPTGVIQATGTIEVTKVDISSKVPGRIERLAVAESDPIQKGQVVVVLEQSDVQANLVQNRMIVARAETTAKDMEAGSRTQEIAEAKAAVDKAESDLDRARKDWQRFRQLNEKGIVPAMELDRSKNIMDSADSQLKRAKQQLSLLKEGVRPLQIKAAKEEAQRARAAVTLVKTQVDDRTIRAPLDGTVLSKYLEEGEAVSAGAPILTAADLSRPWIRVYVPENEVGKIKLGHQARVYVDSAPGKPFPGKVIQINDEAEFTPKNIQTKKERVNLVFGIKIALENPDGFLKPGMPADAEIVVAAGDK